MYRHQYMLEAILVSHEAKLLDPRNEKNVLDLNIGTHYHEVEPRRYRPILLLRGDP